MPKIAIAVIAVLGIGYLALHGRGEERAAKTRSCLEQEGASVQQSTFFEEVFTAAAAEQGEQMPAPFMDLVRNLEKYFYEVRFADTTATLLFARDEGNAEQLQVDATQLEVPLTTVPPQRYGSVLVFWPQAPTAAASASVSGCLT